MKRSVTSSVSLKPVLQALLRRKVAFSLAFLAALSAVVLATFFTPSSYQSQAKLFLRLGRENVALDPTSTIGQGPALAVPHSREEEINSVIEILQSRVLLETVTDFIGPEVILGRQPFEPSVPAKVSIPAGASQKPGPQNVVFPLQNALPATDVDREPNRFQAVRKAASSLKVTATKKSNIVNIFYTGSSPELARAVVTKLIDAFLDQHFQMNRTPAAYDFLSQQADRLKRQLTDMEEDYQKRKNQTGLYSLKEQRENLVKQVGSLQQELLSTSSSLIGAEAQVRHLKKQLLELPSTQVTVTKGLPNQAMENMRAQFFSLQLKERELLAKYPENHPEIVLVSKQVEEAKKILPHEERLEQTVTGPSKAHEEARVALVKEEALLASLQAKVPTLQTQLQQETAKLNTLDENSLALEKAKRDIELHDNLYRKYSENLEQALIDQTLKAEKISSVSIAQPATFELRPISPRWPLSLGLGFLFALAAGCFVAFILERADPTIKSPVEAVSRLELPVLASLPLARERPLFFRDQAGALSVTAGLADRFWQLLTSLPGLSAPDGCACQTLGIISCRPGEGTSTTCLGLALTAISLGRRVLLVDCKPAGHSLPQLLGITLPAAATVQSPGGTDLTVFSPDSVPGLFYLPLGYLAAPERADLALSEARLQALKDEYALLIFDLPPLARPKAALLLTGRLDAMVLVIEAEITPHETLLRAKAVLEKAGSQVIGVVLNEQRQYLPSWLERLL